MTELSRLCGISRTTAYKDIGLLEQQKGGESLMSTLDAFLLSVLASVVAYYICKWLDGE